MASNADRQAYVAKLKGQLDEWNAQIDRLSAKAQQAQAEARIEYQKQLHELKGRQSDLRDRLDKLAAAGDDVWEEVKRGVDQTWESVSKATQSVADKLR